ncbi:MAG: hypothetical protein JO047_08725 [Alphaproteobacteria bacterium]|nr:hypothetical protein [Alphaproteobacteria bacterium]
MAPTLIRAAIGVMLGCALPPASGPARAAAALCPAAAPAVAAAVRPVANWQNPYGNIDRRWDAGNDTGDWMVDRLNQQQLNRVERGGYYPRPRRYRPPPGYYAPYPYRPGY